MATNNQKVLAEAFKRFEKQIRDASRARLEKWCDELIRTAVRMRLGDNKAHNFTGNLLNSIVVGMYEDKRLVYECYANDVEGVKPAIRAKMTNRKKPYYFKGGDYDGRESYFKAEVATNGSWGEADARNFLHRYTPAGYNMFDIIVAYTTEYADFVQQKRNTTGILETRGYALKTGVKFMELKAA